ncbi:UDP-glucose 4-epimerase, partial [Pseudidiomarina aestuarii]
LKLLVRRPSEIECASEVICDLVALPDLSDSLSDVNCVIHCAARAHVMNEVPDAIDKYREVNVTGTLHLARAAAEAGVRRFVYLSSVKVHGESTTNRKPFSSASEYAPVDPYGVSKVEAEQALRELCNDYPMELVIIRPPLVYGPGVKANFRSLMNLAAKNLPLPLGSA